MIGSETRVFVLIRTTMHDSFLSPRKFSEFAFPMILSRYDSVMCLLSLFPSVKSVVSAKSAVKISAISAFCRGHFRFGCGSAALCPFVVFL